MTVAFKVGTVLTGRTSDLYRQKFLQLLIQYTNSFIHSRRDEIKVVRYTNTTATTGYVNYVHYVKKQTTTFTRLQ